MGKTSDLSSPRRITCQRPQNGGAWFRRLSVPAFSRDFPRPTTVLRCSGSKPVAVNRRGCLSPRCANIVLVEVCLALRLGRPLSLNGSREAASTRPSRRRAMPSGMFCCGTLHVCPREPDGRRSVAVSLHPALGPVIGRIRWGSGVFLRAQAPGGRLPEWSQFVGRIPPCQRVL